MSEHICQDVDVKGAAALLRQADRVLLLTHQYPDGDTIGSGFALCRALQHSGKRARVICADEIPTKYDYITGELQQDMFEPACICAVDVADPKLLGHALQLYADKVDLCIDHHLSNTHYARYLLLKDYAATAMIVCELIRELGVPFDRLMAESIYTGIATDTGCFKYSNADAYTHRMAADMLDYPVRAQMINRAMFDVKSRARIELERLALAGITFAFDGRVSFMPITLHMVEQSGASENDMEGLAPLPRQIEGVWVGVTLREKQDGRFKVSVRTDGEVSAAEICKQLGGGGHAGAAGCQLDGPLDLAISRLLTAIAQTAPDIQNSPDSVEQ